MNRDRTTTHVQKPNFWRTRTGIALLVMGAVSAFFLLSEHQAHVFGALPYLLLIGCLLMHVFMHRGHGSHGVHGAHGSEATRDDEISKQTDLPEGSRDTPAPRADGS